MENGRLASLLMGGGFSKKAPFNTPTLTVKYEDGSSIRTPYMGREAVLNFLETQSDVTECRLSSYRGQNA